MLNQGWAKNNTHNLNNDSSFLLSAAYNPQFQTLVQQVIQMRRIKVLLDFMAYSVVEKVAFYRNISNQLADTTLFPSPDIPLATIKTVVDDFESAVLDAKDGAHSAIAVRNNKEKAADDLFRLLVNYVNKVADGDESIIIQSGFHASKQPTPHQKPELAVNHGAHSGSVTLIVKAVPGAVAYRWQYIQEAAPNSTSVWTDADIGTVTTFQIDNLNRVLPIVFDLPVFHRRALQIFVPRSVK